MLSATKARSNLLTIIMSHRLITLLLFTLAALTASHIASAQSASVTRSWLLGAGHTALYDEYLSPLDYAGPDFSFGMQNQRTPRWGDGHVMQLTQFELDGAYTTHNGGNGHIYDGQVTVGFGWFYRLGTHDHPGWGLDLGGLAEFSGGGSYSTRNGNNPAQGRAAFDIAPAAIFTYAFRAPRRLRITSHDSTTDRLQEHCCALRVQLDVPLAGVMFAPQYGQSYYELFSLGHYDHNVCFAYPLNAPSARLQATLHVPVSRHTQIIVGYRGEARQSRINHLGRHAWDNGGIIGFTRDLKF